MLRDSAGYLQHVDRIVSGISIQVHRSAAPHFRGFGRPGRDFDCRRQKPFSDVVRGRDFRVPPAARLYLHGVSQGGRDARSCRRAMVIAGKSEASVDISRTPDVAAFRFPFPLCTSTANLAPTAPITRSSGAHQGTPPPFALNPDLNTKAAIWRNNCNKTRLVTGQIHGRIMYVA